MFGLDHKTAVRYADNARQLLITAVEEQDPPCNADMSAHGGRVTGLRGRMPVESRTGI